MGDRVGQFVGKYRLIRLLGHGGFAEVYLGEHVVTGSQVAFKLLRDQLSPADIERFRSEGRAIAELDHPHIVRLLGLDTIEETLFLVMEYAPGGTLRDRYPQGARVPLKAVVAYVQQIADALQYAHDRNWVHRDLKPENILLSAQGEALLSDFGVALLIQHTSTLSKKEVAGTAAYMAPEQIESKPQSASDQYALAVMIYEWLAGERPFEGTPLELYGKHLHATPPPLREKAPELPTAVEQVLNIALAKDPKARFANVSAFAHALEQASRGIAPILYEPTQVTPRPAHLDSITIPSADNPGLTRSATGSRSAARGAFAFDPEAQDAERPQGARRSSSSLRPVSAGPLPGASVPGQARTGSREQPRGLLSKVLVAVLALVLIGVASGALLLTRRPSATITQSAPPATVGIGSATGQPNPTSVGSGSPTSHPSHGKTPSPGSSSTPTRALTPTRAPTSTFTPTPQPPVDNASFAGESGFPTVTTDQQYSIYFVMQNTGNTTWTDAAGYSLLCTSTCLGAPSTIGFNGQSIGSGQTYQFNITQTAPSSPGTDVTWWQMVHNGQTFGPQLDISVTIQASWKSWYSVNRPACDDASVWQSIGSAATVDCKSSSSGLVLSQYSNTKWAELDLESPNGNSSYNQTQFRVSVQAGLLNPSDTTVSAALLVQTPKAAGVCGGYILAINSQGNWKLQQVLSSCSNSTLASGQISINPGSFTMQVTVQNGQLWAYINGQTLVNGMGDSLNPSPGAVGLMEESSKATSSAILYSSFEFDLWE